MANEAPRGDRRQPDDSLDEELVGFLLDVLDEEDTGQITRLSEAEAARVLREAGR